ncbi:MAG TPA: transaldolase, partial [Gammaproteobacteria bacterium]|nr:transaldolase [Gammaproteobacteria bacterium]
SDVLYVESLIGENTVNTIPPATAKAFNDHGNCAATLKQGQDTALQEFSKLKELGVDVDNAMLQLENEGVDAFKVSFDNLLTAIQKKMDTLKPSSANSSAA